MAAIDRSASVLVTGHRGLVGSAIVRCLQEAGFNSIVTASRHDVDLRDQKQVDDWFARTQPTYVLHVAGKVGGILANNTYPADFLYDNILMHATVMKAACEQKVTKLLYLGSSCIYPRECPQPIKEEYLLTGPLERTNDAYAIAKISGLVACQAYRRQHGCDFISAMPTNLYGPNDNFSPTGSHVLPALIRRFHEARELQLPKVTIWGTGKPMREFLHVDDLARACLFLLENYSGEQTINVGTGEDVTIAELAQLVRQTVYAEVELEFDTTKPDGTPRKLLDVSRLHGLGWKHEIPLPQGVRETYQWFLDHQNDFRG